MRHHCFCAGRQDFAGVFSLLVSKVKSSHQRLHAYFLLRLASSAFVKFASWVVIRLVLIRARRV